MPEVDEHSFQGTSESAQVMSRDRGTPYQGDSGAGRKGRCGGAGRGRPAVPVRTRERKAGLEAVHEGMRSELLPKPC